jgi:hypothetical protein
MTNKKLPYDGKGQPVPDGVVVKVWLTFKEHTHTKLSQHVGWTYGYITHYQVQEMPVEQELPLDTSDLVISSYRDKNASAWSTQESNGIRITHIPSGIYAECIKERSAHTNRATAMDILREKLKAGWAVKPDTTTISTKLHSEIGLHLTLSRNALKVLHAKGGATLELITINQEISAIDKILAELGEGK